jgi:hypothetical protein
MNRAWGTDDGEIDIEVERLKLDCQHELNQLRLAALIPNVKEMDERARRVIDLTRNPKMPVDTNIETLKEVKAAELMGYQKATDSALRKAMSFGLENRSADKQKALAIAQAMFQRALMRGCSDEFKRATEMTLESATLTGDMKKFGANRAKQADETPAMVARAKNEQRGAKRYAEPALVVTVASATFQTVNWSISGMLLADCVPTGIEPGQETTITVFPPQRNPVVIPIRVVRIDPETRRTSLTYSDESPPEVWAFFKKLILSKAPSAPSQASAN